VGRNTCIIMIIIISEYRRGPNSIRPVTFRPLERIFFVNGIRNSNIDSCCPQKREMLVAPSSEQVEMKKEF